jgi:hypothetical protein
MPSRVTAWTAVVPVEPFLDILRHAHVLTRRVALTAKHVDETAADAQHARATSMFSAVGETQ